MLNQTSPSMIAQTVIITMFLFKNNNWVQKYILYTQKLNPKKGKRHFFKNNGHTRIKILSRKIFESKIILVYLLEFFS